MARSENGYIACVGGQNNVIVRRGDTAIGHVDIADRVDNDITDRIDRVEHDIVGVGHRETAAAGRTGDSAVIAGAIVKRDRTTGGVHRSSAGDRQRSGIGNVSTCVQRKGAGSDAAQVDVVEFGDGDRVIRGIGNEDAEVIGASADNRDVGAHTASSQIGGARHGDRAARLLRDSTIGRGDRQVRGGHVVHRDTGRRVNRRVAADGGQRTIDGRAAACRLDIDRAAGRDHIRSRDLPTAQCHGKTGNGRSCAGRDIARGRGERGRADRGDGDAAGHGDIVDRLDIEASGRCRQSIERDCVGIKDVIAARRTRQRCKVVELVVQRYGKPCRVDRRCTGNIDAVASNGTGRLRHSSAGCQRQISGRVDIANRQCGGAIGDSDGCTIDRYGATKGVAGIVEGDIAAGRRHRGRARDVDVIGGAGVGAIVDRAASDENQITGIVNVAKRHRIRVGQRDIGASRTHCTNEVVELVVQRYGKPCRVDRRRTGDIDAIASNNTGNLRHIAASGDRQGAGCVDVSQGNAVGIDQRHILAGDVNLAAEIVADIVEQNGLTGGVDVEEISSRYYRSGTIDRTGRVDRERAVDCHIGIKLDSSTQATDATSAISSHQAQAAGRIDRRIDDNRVISIQCQRGSCGQNGKRVDDRNIAVFAHGPADRRQSEAVWIGIAVRFDCDICKR